LTVTMPSALPPNGNRRRSSSSQDRASLQQRQHQAGPAPDTPTRRFSLPTPPEQDHFEALCRQRFYNRDTDATRQIERILKDPSTTPTSQNCYNKILSTVRARYHEDVARERQEELDRLMKNSNPDVFMPREERKEKLQHFLESHTSKEMIGTHPFVKALWTMLSLQAAKSGKGGGGEMCVEWTIADEVRDQSSP